MSELIFSVTDMCQISDIFFNLIEKKRQFYRCQVTLFKFCLFFYSIYLLQNKDKLKIRDQIRWNEIYDCLNIKNYK